MGEIAVVRRLGLALLGAVELAWGLWALAAPRQFFTHFPGLGHHWTAAYPPYNSHLVSDLGATFTTLGVMLLVAAIRDNRMLTTTVLVTNLLFGALHLSYHLREHGGMSGGGYAASITALALGVVLPAALLALNRRTGSPGTVDVEDRAADV